MAGDLALIPLLLGLGMDELSVGASLVPRVKRAVQSLDLAECQKLVTEIWSSTRRLRFWRAALRWRRRVTGSCWADATVHVDLDRAAATSHRRSESDE